MPNENELTELRRDLSALASAVDRLGRSRDVSDLTSLVERLVRSLEQDDQLKARAERAEERERDRRDKREDEERERLMQSLDAVNKAIENMRQSLEGVGMAFRDLPDRMLTHIEKKIYELRVARYEARQAGFSNEPAPLPETPSRRDPTEKVIAIIEGKQPPQLTPHEDTTALTPAQQRWITRMIGKAWQYKIPHVGGGLIGGHWLIERLAALWSWLSHLSH